MSESIYDDLPDDNEKAFIYLEKQFREGLDQSLRDNDQGNYDVYCKRRYMNAVIAIAKSLEIPGISDYTVPYEDQGVWNTFEAYGKKRLSRCIMPGFLRATC